MGSARECRSPRATELIVGRFDAEVTRAFVFKGVSRSLFGVLQGPHTFHWETPRSDNRKEKRFLARFTVYQRLAEPP